MGFQCLIGVFLTTPHITHGHVILGTVLPSGRPTGEHLSDSVNAAWGWFIGPGVLISEGERCAQSALMILVLRH